MSTILIPILHCFGREQGPKSQRKYKGSQHLNPGCLHSTVNTTSCWHGRITAPSFFRPGRFPWLYTSNRILGYTFKFHAILSKYNQVSLAFLFPKSRSPGPLLALESHYLCLPTLIVLIAIIITMLSWLQLLPQAGEGQELVLALPEICVPSFSF